MSVLILDRPQVESLLDLDQLIDALAAAMADLSTGRASAPHRTGAVVPERGGLLAAMPGYVPSAGVLMTKLVSLFPHNRGGPLPTHQAVIVAFDPATGRPEALLDGTAITAIRTAAGRRCRPACWPARTRACWPSSAPACRRAHTPGDGQGPDDPAGPGGRAEPAARGRTGRRARCGR